MNFVWSFLLTLCLFLEYNKYSWIQVDKNEEAKINAIFLELGKARSQDKIIHQKHRNKGLRFLHLPIPIFGQQSRQR